MDVLTSAKERKITTRDEARVRGLKSYFTGKACIHGHLAERRITTGVCIECDRIRAATYRKKNRERIRAYLGEWRRNKKLRSEAKRD
jgi:hypothetical protein